MISYDATNILPLLNGGVLLLTNNSQSKSQEKIYIDGALSYASNISKSIVLI